MRKRLISFLIAIAVCLTMMPAGAVAANTYSINGKSVRYDDYYSEPHECWKYANNVYNKIWGKRFTNQFGDPDNMLRKKSDSELTLTAKHLKEYVSKAGLGSCLRICNRQYLHGSDGWGHSQIIVQKDDKGFTVFEGGLSAYPYRREKYYTWKEYIKTEFLGGTYSYIKYIKWPGYNLAVPEVSAENVASTGKIKISWDKICGAAQYEVYRSASKNGKYVKRMTVTGKRYINTSAKAGEKYYYKVRAVNSEGTTGKFSEVVSAVCRLPQPVIKFSNVADTGKVKVKWEEIDGAAKYSVYRADSKTGKYKKLVTTKNTSYIDGSAKAGTTYYYKVKAIFSDNSDANSAMSEIKSRCCDMARPVVKIMLSGGEPKISWAKIDGAKDYEIYRATGSTGTYKLLTTQSKKSYVDSSAKAGKTYYYKVKAVNGKAAAASANSVAVSIKAK